MYLSRCMVHRKTCALGSSVLSHQLRFQFLMVNAGFQCRPMWFVWLLQNEDRQKWQSTPLHVWFEGLYFSQGNSAYNAFHCSFLCLKIAYLHWSWLRYNQRWWTLYHFQIVFPGIAFLRLAVCDDNGKVIGQRFLSVAALEQGIVTLIAACCIRLYLGRFSEACVRAALLVTKIVQRLRFMKLLGRSVSGSRHQSVSSDK